MKNKSSRYELLVGTILFIVAASIPVIVFATNSLHTYGQILLVICGLLSMLAISIIQNGLKSNKSQMIEMHFNETLLSEMIFNVEEIIQKEHRKAFDGSIKGKQPWEISPVEMLGKNNSLALAMVRIEIEKELRLVAHYHGIDVQHRPMGITQLANELVKKEVLPEELISPLKEVSNVCNRAIHGEEVQNETAESVVRVGEKILDRLRYFVR